MLPQKDSPGVVMHEMGIDVDSVFIPFSQSRNKDSKHKSLNWKVTLKLKGKEVLTTDYSAGVAHCPSYNKKAPSLFRGPQSTYQALVTDAECEIGKPVKGVGGSDSFINRKDWIEPDPVDVLYSLVMDSSVLDYTGFEDWAECLGYDIDSRNAESIWKACLEIALKMRAHFGDSGMAKLQTTFEDY